MADFERFTLLCFEGCYEIRGNHGTLASCLNLSWVYLYLSTGLSWWFPFLVPPHFPGVPVRSRNVPFRCIGVWGPVYRCSGPDFSLVVDLLRGVPGTFPECSPPLDQWFSGQEVFGSRVFRGPLRPFVGRSRSVWGPSGHEVFGSRPLV